MEIITEEEIKEGIATDAYFERTEEALEEMDRNPRVVAEITESQYTDGPWKVFTGLHEAAEVCKEAGVDLYALEEGRMFSGGPVAKLVGNYKDFARFETALLGILSHHSGIANAALETRLAAPNTKILSFGSRHVHPSIGPMVTRNSLIAGLDGYSFVGAEKYRDIDASGTMPHALVLSAGNREKAWKGFNDGVSEDVPRIPICDTHGDEVQEVMSAVETFGDDLDGVRLDTTSSRRGDFERIIKEVRFHLEKEGREDVEIYVSGGLKPEELKNLSNLVDGFGVGSYISEADCLDFGLDIVNINGEDISKRGKLPGEKRVVRVEGEHKVKPMEAQKESGETEDLLKPVVKDKEIVMNTNVEKAKSLLEEEVSKLSL